MKVGFKDGRRLFECALCIYSVSLLLYTFHDCLS